MPSFSRALIDFIDKEVKIAEEEKAKA